MTAEILSFRRTSEPVKKPLPVHEPAFYAEENGKKIDPARMAMKWRLIKSTKD